MAGILRGDIIWADLNPVIGHEQAGLRPVIVLSHAVFNRHSGTVIAVADINHFVWFIPLDLADVLKPFANYPALVVTRQQDVRLRQLCQWPPFAVKKWLGIEPPMPIQP